MNEINEDSKTIGRVQISDEVIAIIAGTATMEVEGVVSTGGNLTNDIVGMFGKNKKNFSKGVFVEVIDNLVRVEVGITVKFGTKIHEVASKVQEKVKNAIETMTGFNVEKVDVDVIAVVDFENQ